MLIQELKNRITNIRSIRKITRAMELVAVSKLQRVKKSFEKSQAYYDLVMQTYEIFLKSLPRDFKFTSHVKKPINLYIVITSDYGLCGSYNSNVLKMVTNVLLPEDQLVVIGAKGISYFNNIKRKINNQIENLNDNFNYQDIRSLISLINAKVISQEVQNVIIANTEYINSITFKPTLNSLLNFKKSINKPTNLVEFEPDAQTILIKTLPLYLGAIIFGKIVESKVAETAMRRIAMESATDNADDLIENLSIKYNQARQALITQEIAEIVSGADITS